MPAATALASVTTLLMAGCGTTSILSDGAATGPDPVLPSPQQSLIPTVDIAPAEGWPSGVTPTPAPGLSVQRFADGLVHPRWLLVLPNGDVLVAETNGPPGKSGITGIKGKIM
ncbi:MAG: sorbosone dehydrogenase family protein, partial [Thermomonas sp.]